MARYLILCLMVITVAVMGHPVNRIETELDELFEMIPYDDVLSLGMEYSMTDDQVKSFIKYISGPKFKSNLAQLEGSPQFRQLLTHAEKCNINSLEYLNKLNVALSLPMIPSNYYRSKRSPGSGVAGLVKDAFEITPISDIKEAYKYKIEENPHFKGFMSEILSSDPTIIFGPLVQSKPFQDTKKDLEELGIIVKEIEEFIHHQLTNFFEIQTPKIEELKI